VSRLYADHNATSPLREEARVAMLGALDLGGNPSSVHGEGRAAKRVLEDARETLAGVLECQADAITLTSGATEALHIALESARMVGFEPVFLSAVEHEAVSAYAQNLWPGLELIPVDHNALIDVDWLARRIEQTGGQPLVIAQAANNETGTIQKLVQLSTLARKAGGAFLCDGVQAFGKISVGKFGNLADWLIVSSHKIGGPAGAGALIAAPGALVLNTRPGGGQERGLRAGTPNVAAVAGFAAAARVGCRDEAVAAFSILTQTERNAFERTIAEALPIQILAQGARRLPSTSCVALPGWEAARQVMALDLMGAAVSAGAACSSGKVKTSRVLAAAGFDAGIAGCAIRASFGWTTQPGDGTRLAELYLNAAARAAPRTPEKVQS
jgi:cysteine desulfurase